jgi:hypothetical protein
MSYRGVNEVRDGMRIDWDTPIEPDDGLVVRAGHRPSNRGRALSRNSRLWEVAAWNAWRRIIPM